MKEHDFVYTKPVSKGAKAIDLDVAQGVKVDNN